MLVSIGTRGDMEPFLAAGVLLEPLGHEIVCVFPEQFRGLAEECGFRFISLGPEFMEMLDSDPGKAALGGSSSTLKKIISYSKLARQFREVSRKLVQRQREAVEKEKPDRIVHHAKATYPLLWSISHAKQAILLSPVPYVVHATREHSHVVFNRNLGPSLNKATYALARYGLVKTVLKSAKMLDMQPGPTGAQLRAVLQDNPAVYAISPSLFEPPAYWPAHYQVLGYHERDKTTAWEPEPELLKFLETHKKFLLVTFGSMSNPEPEVKTRMVLNVLRKMQIPAVVNCAGGGLREPEDYDRKQYCFVRSIPYDYIFPKTYAVVHHGGSGTTHMALKYGCASLIIPHIIDQYLWNTIGYKKGVGPKGPSITALNERNFTTCISGLWEDGAYKKRAEEIGRAIRKEDFGAKLVATITG